MGVRRGCVDLQPSGVSTLVYSVCLRSRQGSCDLQYHLMLMETGKDGCYVFKLKYDNDPHFGLQVVIAGAMVAVKALLA